ncbi:MAG: hypothetical protein H0W73_00050 [Bacteroidetes bacterium]|nr:hypothetical protein [Bacteroidota bacterium]
MNKLKILVVSFYFPPYDKVGGRRWAKHCKYLKEENIEFTVLCGNFKGNSAWDKDLLSYKDQIERVDVIRKYEPYHLKTLPRNFPEKAYWKLSLLFWEWKKKKLQGNYFDASTGNEELFFEHAISLVKNKNINTVIISCGPFTYSTILPRLKKEFPQLKFIIDYRDYWEDGFDGLIQNQIRHEIKMQQKVLDSVDLILSPNSEMEKHFAATGKLSYLLPHCFDEQDLLIEDKKSETNSDFINLLYGGAFYGGIEENLDLIKKFVDALNVFKSAKAEFYVSIKGYESELTHPNIRRHGFINAIEYFKKVQESDYVLLILAPNRVNAMSSKFFELVAMRKPILYFGGAGAVSEFIEKFNLGFHITRNNVDKKIDAVLKNNFEKTVPDLSYDISTYTFEHQTKKLINQLQLL